MGRVSVVVHTYMGFVAAHNNILAYNAIIQ